MSKNGSSSATKIDVAVLKTQFDNMQKTMDAILSSQKSLEVKFDNMEAGRLSSIEVKYGIMSSDITLLKKIVYGAVGFMLIALLGAVISGALGHPVSIP